jgi:ABC-type nitrate/sulfonate/bicarbonate transport system substrate-binding protein
MNSFVTNERSIRERKEIISKFLRSIKKSVEFTHNNPQDSLESFLEALPVLNNSILLATELSSQINSSILMY